MANEVLDVDWNLKHYVFMSRQLIHPQQTVLFSFSFIIILNKFEEKLMHGKYSSHLEFKSGFSYYLGKKKNH